MKDSGETRKTKQKKAHVFYLLIRTWNMWVMGRGTGIVYPHPPPPEGETPVWCVTLGKANLKYKRKEKLMSLFINQDLVHMGGRAGYQHGFTPPPCSR